ncbi:MAG: hypothetical protein CMC96_01065 [Flavobacteriales bacterium]|nr:hypothetical protein [Flavobacteriales bacterium]|tara:strand:- start:21813 stop:22259 length:447 start_codon:yes stop_codon:yes gene_type:complete
MSLKFINYPVNEAPTEASAFCSPEPLDYSNLPNEHFIWVNTSLIIKDINDEKNNVFRLGWKVNLNSKKRYGYVEFSRLYIHSKDKNDQDESKLKNLLENLYASLTKDSYFKDFKYLTSSIPKSLDEGTLNKAIYRLQEQLTNPNLNLT